MTKERRDNWKKIWLENATNEQLLEQMRSSTVAMTTGNIKEQVEANEDYELVKAEILKRMSK